MQNTQHCSKRLDRFMTPSLLCRAGIALYVLVFLVLGVAWTSTTIMHSWWYVGFCVTAAIVLSQVGSLLLGCAGQLHISKTIPGRGNIG